jgi:branched-chain amino acid transport system permease protein
VSFLLALVSGIALGGVYALMSAGLSLIFGVMRLANFAQGDFVMLGMYGAYIAWQNFGWDPYLAIIPVAIIIGIFGGGIELAFIERLPIGNHNPQLLLTLGLSLVLENAVTAFKGSTPYVVSTSYSDSYWQPLKGLLIPEAQIYAGVASVIAMAVLYILLNRTRLGQALRATADDSDAASWVGINTRRMRGFGFGLGVAIAAAAGCALVTFNTATPTVGLNYLFIMFVSVVLGGVGSIPGSIIGAFLVGIVQSLATLVLPLQWDNGIVYLLLLLVLLVRPSGLFGLRVRV